MNREQRESPVDTVRENPTLADIDWNTRQNRRIEAERALDPRYRDEEERQKRKQAQIAAGLIMDLDQARTTLSVEGDDAGNRAVTTKAKAKGKSLGGSGQSKRIQKPPKSLYEPCHNCGRRRTFDEIVCKCGAELLPAEGKRRRGRPRREEPTESAARSFGVLPHFLALLVKSRAAAKKRGERFGIADFLRFWLFVDALGFSMETAGYAHMFRRGNAGLRSRGQRGAPSKWGEISAKEWHERLPLKLVSELEAANVDVSANRQTDRTLGIYDVALTAFEIFIAQRFALLHHSLPMRELHDFEPIAFDPESTNLLEMRIVGDRMKRFYARRTRNTN